MEMRKTGFKQSICMSPTSDGYMQSPTMFHSVYDQYPVTSMPWSLRLVMIHSSSQHLMDKPLQLLHKVSTHPNSHEHLGIDCSTTTLLIERIQIWLLGSNGQTSNQR